VQIQVGSNLLWAISWLMAIPVVNVGQYLPNLVKDKEIIAAEVMHEYDEKVRCINFCITKLLSEHTSQFVYPRINPYERRCCNDPPV